MFELKVSVPFSFEHQLKGFGEAFEKVHHHTWKVGVILNVEALDQRGVSVDFNQVKKDLTQLLEGYQGKLLNRVPMFAKLQPTAEHIAMWAAEELSGKYPGLISGVQVGTGQEQVTLRLC